MGRTFNNLEHCVYSCKYHIVWCTKYRLKVLVDDIETRLKEMLAIKSIELGCELLEIEVMPDHIHLLAELPPTESIGTYIGRLKGYTAHELRKEFPKLKSRMPNMWTNSYFVSSCGGVTLEQIEKYVTEQKNK